MPRQPLDRLQLATCSWRDGDLLNDDEIQRIGALTVTRPVYRNFSFGLGVWGGAQPGLSRLDAGPRVTMQMRKNVKVHADWRQKLAGNARPGSGPALTLSGDF